MRLKKTLTVKVTQEHIDRARTLRHGLDYRPSQMCPIALAMTGRRRLMKFGVGVSIACAYDKKDEGITFGIYELPREVKIFVNAFDARDYDAVKPFEFTAVLLQSKGKDEK